VILAENGADQWTGHEHACLSVRRWTKRGGRALPHASGNKADGLPARFEESQCLRAGRTGTRMPGMGVRFTSEVRVGNRRQQIVDQLMKSLPGAAVHPAVLPQGNVALFVVWPGFEKMDGDQRKQIVQTAVIGSSHVAMGDYFSGIHSYTPREYDELQRNDICVIPGEEFTVTVSLLRELKPDDSLAIEWSGPVDSSAGQDLPVCASTVERVTETIYNVKGTVPAAYPDGLYRNVKAIAKDRSGKTVEQIADLIRPYLLVASKRDCSSVRLCSSTGFVCIEATPTVGARAR